MLEWILEKLPVVIFVVVFVTQIVRGFLRSRDTKSEPPPRNDELEQDRRNREVQEDIRRKIAQRRAAEQAARPLAEREQQMERERPAPPAIPQSPMEMPLPEPLKRMLQELERKVQPAPTAEAPRRMTPPPLERSARNELERQERIADDLRAVEEARLVTKRRAAHITAAKEQHAQTEGALQTMARGRLLDDLQDPESLRRAFVLREVLGTPVGLR